MRLAGILALWLCVLPFAARAEFSVRLVWQVPPEPDVAGYRIYVRVPGVSSYPSPEECESSIACIDIGSSYQGPALGRAAYTLSGFPSGRVYKVAMSAYDWAGNESGLSNEIDVAEGDCTGSGCGGGSFCSDAPDGTECGAGMACFAGVCAEEVAPIVVSDVDISPAPPQPVGTRFVLTAQATGGVAPLQYKWHVNVDGTWIVLRDWSTDATVAWKPPKAGFHRVVVWVRSDGNTVDEPEGDSAMLLTSLNVAEELRFDGIVVDGPEHGAIGSSVTLSAPAWSLSTLEYRWLVQRDTCTSAPFWSTIRSWNTSNTISWAPDFTDPCSRIRVEIRARGSSELLGYDELAFPVYDVRLVAITTNVPPPQRVGTKVVVTAVTEGRGGPFEYRWYEYVDAATGWVMRLDWTLGADRVTTVIGTASPDKQIGVWVRSPKKPAGTPHPRGSIPFPTLP